LGSTELKLGQDHLKVNMICALLEKVYRSTTLLCRDNHHWDYVSAYTADLIMATAAIRHCIDGNINMMELLTLLMAVP
jgi:hypothetical protein